MIRINPQWNGKSGFRLVQGDIDSLVPGCKMLTWGDYLKRRIRHSFDDEGNLVIETAESSRERIGEHIKGLVARGLCGEDGVRKTEVRYEHV